MNAVFFLWKWVNTTHMGSAMWEIMVWYFSNRASVATVLSTHPCVSRCLWISPFKCDRGYHLVRHRSLGINNNGIDLVLLEYHGFNTTWVNTLRQWQNGRHFPHDIFKWIFLNENVWISIHISLKFVPRGPITNIPTLVQVMAWRRPGDKPLSEPMMVRLPTHICVSRPQWVKYLIPTPKRRTIFFSGGQLTGIRKSALWKTTRELVWCWSLSVYSPQMLEHFHGNVLNQIIKKW